MRWKRRLPESVLSDAIGELTVYNSSKAYPDQIRKVCCWEPSPLQVAELYKNGWQVELFFKWFKQHLKIKKFWGATENAARIQIYSAIITYCLVATIQYDLRLDRSTYEVLQVLSISLADKTLYGV